MTDLMEHLRDARPSDVELDRMWPAAQRAEVLDRILANPVSKRRSRHRTVWLGAAAAAAAFVLVPNVLDSGDASARGDLKELAMAALSTGGPVIEEGTFLHVKTEAIQRNSSTFSDGMVLDTNREKWIRWDGTIWAVDHRPSAGWREYHFFKPPESPSPLGNPTPETVASLPDDPAALRDYLDAHVSGSDSHEEAIFTAVTGLARSNFLPPKTLAAALEVLADVEGVETEDVVERGRPAVEVTFEQRWGGFTGTESVVLDRATARVIAEHDSDPGGSYDLTTTLVEVVDSIPADVREAYRELPNGERLYE